MPASPVSLGLCFPVLSSLETPPAKTQAGFINSVCRISRGEAEQLVGHPRDPLRGLLDSPGSKERPWSCFFFTLPHLCVLRNCDLDRPSSLPAGSRSGLSRCRNHAGSQAGEESWRMGLSSRDAHLLFLGRKSESLNSRFPAWPAPDQVHLLLAVSVDLT